VDSSGQLATLLAEASEDELLELVQEHLTAIDQAAARQAIKNSYASREVLELLASHKTLMSRREFRRAIAEHRQCPEPLALRLVTTLFWRDLVEIGVSMGVRPTVRRAADRALSGRLTVMSVGERMAVARRSSFAIVSELRHDSERRVIEALLDNPRMTSCLSWQATTHGRMYSSPSSATGVGAIGRRSALSSVGIGEPRSVGCCTRWRCCGKWTFRPWLQTAGSRLPFVGGRNFSSAGDESGRAIFRAPGR